jgi:hypothetical protein
MIEIGGRRLEVCPSGEGLLSGPGQDRHAGLVIAHEAVPGGMQALNHVGVDAVHALGPVDGDGGDPLGRPVGDGVAAGCAHGSFHGGSSAGLLGRSCIGHHLRRPANTTTIHEAPTAEMAGLEKAHAITGERGEERR